MNQVQYSLQSGFYVFHSNFNHHIKDENSIEAWKPYQLTNEYSPKLFLYRLDHYKLGQLCYGSRKPYVIVIG